MTCRQNLIFKKSFRDAPDRLQFTEQEPDNPDRDIINPDYKTAGYPVPNQQQQHHNEQQCLKIRENLNQREGQSA